MGWRDDLIHKIGSNKYVEAFAYGGKVPPRQQTQGQSESAATEDGVHTPHPETGLRGLRPGATRPERIVSDPKGISDSSGSGKGKQSGPGIKTEKGSSSEEGGLFSGMVKTIFGSRSPDTRLIFTEDGYVTDGRSQYPLGSQGAKEMMQRAEEEGKSSSKNTSGGPGFKITDRYGKRYVETEKSVYEVGTGGADQIIRGAGLDPDDFKHHDDFKQFKQAVIGGGPLHIEDATTPKLDPLKKFGSKGRSIG